MDAAQLPAWLFKVAKNRAVDNWRKWSKEQSFEEETATVGVVEQAKLISFERLVANTSLKPVHRVCLVLRFVQGMSRDEIAKETGLTASQVKGHLQYALRILRKEMGGYRDAAQSEARRRKINSEETRGVPNPPLCPSASHLRALESDGSTR